MSEIIHGQAEFVVACLCNGMLLMLGYDVLRLLRWCIPHSKIAVAIEDVFYWSLAAVPTFSVMFFYNDGDIRWYGMLSLLVGALLYELGISRPVHGKLEKFTRKLKKICENTRKRFSEK